MGSDDREGQGIVLPGQHSMTNRKVLWWSRSGRDYSRDRILRQAFLQLGWQIQDYYPVFSMVGDWQAWLQRIGKPDVVWVPCFRHRDAAAAARWANARHVPIVFDPLISAYDKVVHEQERVPEDSGAARRMLARESSLLQRFEAVVADTECHADYFSREFRLQSEKVGVIPVGAEPGLFVPQPWEPERPRARVLFYGSFIGLQGPEVIAAAARLVPEVDWHFIGDGPLKPLCQQLCQGLPHVTFTPWTPYDQLPSQIGAADILLGVFGTSQKASRVIPNKVYQALACGRVVVTRMSDAYPQALRTASVSETGMQFIPAGSAEALADVIRRVALSRSELPKWGRLARQTYEQHFNPDSIVSSLHSLLTRVMS